MESGEFDLGKFKTIKEGYKDIIEKYTMYSPTV